MSILEKKNANANVGFGGQILSIKSRKGDIFVLQEFEDELLKKLEITKCFRVVGPRCLLQCFFTGESVPPGTSPVFTIAMKDFVVCAYGFNSEIKDEIRKKVEYMGGIYIKELRTCITHRVTDSVMSAKYEKAMENKIPVFTYEWIKAVWNANLTEFTPANDPLFDKYKCSTFMHLIVTTSNLPKRQKEEVKKLINENGGVFMGPLDGTKVEVVLAPDNSSLNEKIKFALQNNIACLKFEWVIKSVNAGYALPFNNYLITAALRALSSTLENASTQIIHSSLNFSAISNIPNDNSCNFIEESMSNTIAINHDNVIDRNISPCVSIIERLDKPQTVVPNADNDDDDDDEANIVQQYLQKSNALIN
ncbi:hypothetical protein PV325_013078, partial [Microctonus aethiopoides]